MAYSHSPRIITDGLVLALDAANVKSFRGEPTVNLIHNPSFIDNSGNSIPDGYSISGLSTEGSIIETNNGIVTVTNISSGRAFIAPSSGNLSNLEDGKTYTFSITIHRADNNFRLAWISNNSSIMVNDLIDINKPLPQRGTFTFTSSGSNTIRLGIGVSTVDLGGTVQFSQPQLEEKPYATPFVDGTRGTTVATGGGWADRSGNNNHGELVNGPTFNSDNLGSLVFDGVNSSINLNSVITGLMDQSTSLSFWIFFNTNQTSRNCFLYARGNSTSLGTGGGSDGTSSNTNINFQTRLGSDINFHLPNGNTSTGNLLVIPCIFNQFIYLTVQWNESTNYIEAYINGEFVNSNTSTINFNSFRNSANSITRIGNNGGDQPFNGKISQTSIYNRALTPQEILQNYNATKSRYGL